MTFIPAEIKTNFEKMPRCRQPNLKKSPSSREEQENVKKLQSLMVVYLPAFDLL